MTLDNVNEANALSDHASLSSIEEMIESDPEPNESSFQQNTGFSQSQPSAIKAIVTDLVHSAITTLQPSPATHLTSALTEDLFTCGTASPLCLFMPIEVDFALRSPDTLYQSQTPEIQLHLDDSSSGRMGSAITIIRKKKLVIDIFL